MITQIHTTQAEQLAGFVVRASYDGLSQAARLQLKIRVVDALGCAIGALRAEPMAELRAQIDEFGGNPICTMVGGERTAPDRAAFYNGALVRYLDFNDGYLTKGETCHPSDNVAPILAAAEYADASGRDFLAALAVAYQVQCRLSDVAPVRDKGFDPPLRVLLPWLQALLGPWVSTLGTRPMRLASAARRSTHCA